MPGSEHNAGHAAEEEGGQETHCPNHRGIPGDVALPHGANPVEELNAGRNSDEEGHKGEERKQDGAGHEHVVCPNSHGQGADSQNREDQADVAKDWLTGEYRNDLRNNAEEWQCQDVNLRVAEEPEEVLPQDRAAVSGVVNVAAKLTVVEDTAQLRSAAGRSSER